jgi:O-antigen ligase
VLATLGIALLAIPLLAVVLFATASPAETLVVLTALSLAVVLLFRIELALLVLIAAGSLEEAFVLSSNPQLTMTKVAGAICFASFARYALTSRRPLLFDRSHAVVIGILLIALASTVQAFDAPIAVTTTTRYASFVALYVIVSQFVGAHRLQRQIAWVLTITAAIGAIIALRSYFTGETVVATLPEANPSDFAFILATTLPLSFWLLGDAPRWRIPLFAAIGLIASATVLSLSRGTMVGLAAGLAWMVLVDRRHVRLVLGGGVLALTVALLVIRSDPSRFETALLYKQKVADYNVTTRYDAWNAAAELAVEKPLLGVGPGNFRFYYNEQTGRPVGTHNLYVAHNAYLDVAAELGILAMILFLVYLGMMMSRLTVAARRGYGLPGYALALRVSLLVAIVSAVFVSEQYYAPFWLLGGLATAIWAEGGRTRRES